MKSKKQISSDSKKNEEEKESKINLKEMSFMERIKYVKSLVTIEPLICCIVASKIVCGPALNNLRFEKACKANAGFNDTVCDSIVSGTYRQDNFVPENNIVQSYVNDVHSWEVPIASIVPVILVMFLGSYSDRHKIRKPFLVMPLIGDVVRLIGSILSVIYMREWSIEILVVFNGVIHSFFGAEKLLIMTSYAYISDISSPDTRIIRLTVIPMILNILIPIIQAISGILFQVTGYIPVFCISFCLLIIAFLNGIFSVKESTPLKEKDDNLIKDIFNIQHVVETFKLLKRNEGNMRTQFLVILLLCFLHNLVKSGEQSTFFLFTQTAYQWTAVDYNYFTTMRTVANFLGLLIAVPLFSKVFNFRDLTIIFISYLDTIFINVIYTVYQSPIGLYIGIGLSLLRAPGHAATRSILTKSVMKDDVAKAFSLAIVTIAIASALSAQIYNRVIYEYTRETFPQAFFLCGICLHIVGLPILLFLYWREKRQETVQEIENTQEEQLDIEDLNSKQVTTVCENVDKLGNGKIKSNIEAEEATHM